jgi:pimeloyl-ACP methyl ester carboxylesterase
VVHRHRRHRHTGRLLHANTGTAASWEAQAQAFSRPGYRVIAFDRRGCDKFHLVGVAGGGFAAIDCAAWHRERLRSLVIGASTGQFSEKEIEEIETHARQPSAPAQPLHTPNTYAKLASVTMPVLVLAADADLLAPPSMMRAWAAHLKNYEFATVPESGHSVAWEQPELFNEKVLAFIVRN